MQYYFRVILHEALLLQDESFGKNYLSFLDFTRNYELTRGIFVPCPHCLIASSIAPDQTIFTQAGLGLY